MHLLVLLCTLLAVLFSNIPSSECCVLCPLRLPPRPRPIDHFQLPSPEQITSSADSIDELCAKAKHLRVSDECRQQVAKIFCSLSALIEAKSNADLCNSTAMDEQTCMECEMRNAQIINDNFWVVTWLDSIGKMPSAISEGNHYWLGEYEQCSDLKKSGAFDGRYCLLQVEVPDSDVDAGCPQTDPLAIDLGICSPERCSEDEVNSILRSSSPYNLTTRCESPREWPFASQVFMSVLLAWVTFLVVGTVIDVSEWSNANSSDFLTRVGRCVSLRGNGYEVLRTKRSHKYHSVQGLQVILIALVVTANCYSFMMPYMENVLFSYDTVYFWPMHILNNFSIHIDALIAINALFTSLLLRNTLITTFDVKKLYVKRLLQVLPAYAFVVIFMTLMFERLSAGPLWNHGELVDRCENSWWKNILFINNLFPVNDTCVDGGYLLALEAQFFIILALLLHLSIRFRKPVIYIASTAIFVSIVYVFYVVYSNALPPTVILTAEPIPYESMEMYLNDVYLKPWSRAPAFLIGFLFSFIFVGVNKIDEIIAAVAWVLLTIATLLTIFAIFPYSTQMKSSPIFIALYAALHRPAWCLVICSVVYLCYRRNGFEFGTFLEWRLFTPLSKLIYLVFVLSEPVSLFLFSSLHRPIYATHWSTLYIALGTIVLSYIVALALDVLISRPTRNLLIFALSPYLQQDQSYEKAATNDIINEEH